MMTIQLDFIQRLKLQALLSAQEGTLGKLAPYLRILETIRFSEAEDAQIVKTSVSESIMNYAAPHSGFGKLTAEIETADAAALLALLDAWPRFSTPDHVWAGPLLAQLK